MNKREWMLRFVMQHGPFWPSAEPKDLVAHVGEIYDAIVAASPEPADEGWIEHRGEKPYPEGMVDIRERGGTVHTMQDADDWFWNHDPDAPEFDIVAWRPARA